VSPKPEKPILPYPQPSPRDHSKVFISHRHEDSDLARAWQELLRGVSAGQVEPWFSSDDRAGAGIQPGEWYDQLRQFLNEAGTILVIVTPGVAEGPWVVFESGYAAGSSIQTIVIYYYMKERHVPDVFRTQQLYNGGDPNAVRRICTDFMHRRLEGRELPAAAINAWAPLIEAYGERVTAEAERSATRALFHDHFHQFDAAEGMKGTWYASWTQIGSDGREQIFEVDNLLAWTTKERIRFVGTSSKIGIDKLGVSARYYPMEGVVSNSRWVALSYWSGGNIPICGTVLLSPRGATGELLEGGWQGFTTPDIHEDPALVRGRVVLARDEARVKDYWKGESIAKMPVTT